MKMRLLIASGFLMCAMRVFAGLSVDGLTVDTLRNPLGIDNPRPRFSWKLQSETPSTVQVAYEVRVAESSSNGAGEWRSTGKVDSENSLYIPYAGPMLASTTSYQWQVRVWDNHGNVSGWSQVARWETGFMQPGEWRAQWITYPWDDDKESSQPSPLLRKQFELKERVVRARLYITSLGLYEAYLNGDRIGDAYFTPGWTSYDKRLQYQVYDVTAALKDGKNALGVMLADGWYRGFLSWDNQRNVYGDRLALLAQLNVEYSDGSRELIATDNSWSAGTGEIRAADIYNGELQDLRLHEEGWSRPDFSAHGWRSAQPYIGKIPKLVASAAQPVRQMELVKPVALLRGPRNEVILDMGQNMVGWLRFDARGEAGRHITLYHTEVLDRDGALYRKALRSAAQKVEYILPDDRVHTLQPHFSFQGFRYVQVDNYPGEIRLDDFTGVALHSDLPPIGHFETSDAMLNQLQSNIRWGQKGNFLDVPTDCPQRDERLGWTGDIQVFASTAAFNMDSSAFLRKWLADVELDQYENGGIPFVVPDVLARLRVHSFQSFFFQLKNSASGWGDAITIAPHALYQQYGDRAFIEEFYDSMKRWVEYERARAGSSLFTWIDYRNWFSSQRRADDRFVWNGSFTFGDCAEASQQGIHQHRLFCPFGAVAQRSRSSAR
jgi:alpha-L-rhamnosidase